MRTHVCNAWQTGVKRYECQTPSALWLKTAFAKFCQAMTEQIREALQVKLMQAQTECISGAACVKRLQPVSARCRQAQGMAGLQAAVSEFLEAAFSKCLQTIPDLMK